MLDLRDIGIKLKNLFGDDKVDPKLVPEISGEQEPETLEMGSDNASSYSLSFDWETKIKNIEELILTYRKASANYEVDDAIDEIVNEAIVKDEGNIVEINLDNVDGISKGIKTKIADSFDEVLQLLDFKKEASKLFRKWYIDGRIITYSMVNKQNQKKGIEKVKILNPLGCVRTKDKSDGKYYYIYKENSKDKTGWRIPEELISFVPSGITDATGKYYISYIHRVIKPLNQLRLLEDSAVIYRITRSPERRVFTIDVGKLSKKKSEEYVKKLMNRFKNKITYDVATGKTTSKKEVMTMLEDFYLPTTSNGQGTKVDTLQGGAQLGEIDDILLFKKKVSKALKVPTSRMDDDDSPTVDFGNPGEITRSELKFSKFVKTIRQSFSGLLEDLLRKHLIYKNIVTQENWDDIVQDIVFDWATDSYWDELKDMEILTNRMELLEAVNEHVNKYFSETWVRKTILKQDDEEIEELKKQREEEAKEAEENGEEEEIPPEEEGEEEEIPPEESKKPKEEVPPKEPEEEKK